MRILRPLVPGLVAIALLAVTACGTDPAPPATSTLPNPNAKFYALLPDAIKTAQVIRFGGDTQAPLRILEADGKTLDGVQNDFSKALEPLLGVKIEPVMVESFAAVKTGLQAGRFDAAWGGLLDSASAEKDLDLIVWVKARPTFLHQKSNSLTGTPDLCGKTVARLTGSAPMVRTFTTISDRCTTATKEKVVPLDLADTASMILAVKSGRAVAAAMQPGDAAYAAAQDTSFGFFLAEGATFPTDYLGAATTKTNTQLRDALLAAMKELWASGQYQSIMDKWSLQAITVPEPILNLAGSLTTAPPAAPSTSASPSASASS